MSTSWANEWDRLLHTPGEIVPASKLVNFQDYMRNTTLAFIHDLLDRFAVGGEKHGVVSGLTPSVTGAPLTLSVSRGTAFYVHELAGGDQIVPCVLEEDTTIAINMGGGGNRYDLICIQPVTTDTDIEAKLVKQADGSYITQNLAQRQSYRAILTVVEGVLGGTCPTAPAGRIPIAAVYTTGVFAGVLTDWDGSNPPAAGHMADVRTWLSAKLGGVSEYHAIGIGVGVAGAITELEEVTDQSIQVGVPLAVQAGAPDGVYRVSLWWPREVSVGGLCVTGMAGDVGGTLYIATGFGTGPTNRFGDAMRLGTATLALKNAAGAGLDLAGGHQLSVVAKLVKQT